MEKYSGRCRCEKITFKISGDPTWKVNCNCNWCQTTSGSAFRSFVIFNEKDITYLKESPDSYEDTKTEHGRPMTNLFCSTCGTIVGIKVCIPSICAFSVAVARLPPPTVTVASAFVVVVIV